MVIKDLLSGYKDSLLEPVMVLSKLLKVDKSYIYTYIDKEVPDPIVEKFNSIMAKRKEDVPLQYLLGEKEFMGLNFYVREGVLIPRNDTEVLVEYLIDIIGNKNLRVLDLGLGSGAIGLSLAHYCENIELTGIDISKEALEVARINKENLGLENVRILEGDLFTPLGQEKFDIIISNPPYISQEEMKDLERQVKDYEPDLALYGGLDGLDFYREISKKSIKYLKSPGLLAYEIGYRQAKDVREILEENLFGKIKIIKDLAGYDRVISGWID